MINILTFFVISICTILAFDNNLEHYKYIDGLSSNNLTDILVDDKNRTWIGTFNGISLYDGNEFQNFYNQDTLSEKYIKCLSEKNSIVWFGTKTALLRSVEKDNQIQIQKFIEYPSGINDIAHIGARLYAVTKNTLLSINTETGKITEKEFRNIKFVHSMNKKLIVATKSKLFFYDVSTGRKEQFGKFSSNINSILINETELYVGASDGLYVYSLNHKKIDLSYKIINYNIVSAAIAKGEVWISTEDDLYKVKNRKLINQNISLDNVKALSFTHENILLIASFGGGLFQLDPYGFNNNNRFGTQNDIQVRKSIKYNNDLLSATNKGLFSKKQNRFILEKDIYDFVIEKNKIMWIATIRGLYSYNGSIINKVLLTDINPNISIISIHLDKMGRKWLGTTKGLIKYDSRIGKEDIFLYNTADGLISNIIYDICTIPGGIATASPNGLNVFKNYNSWISYPYESDDYNGCVYDYKKEALWASTTRSGINLIDIESGEVIETVTINNGLSNNEVLNISIDNSSNLWVATDGGGVSVSDGETWVNIDSRDGLINNSVNSVYQLDSLIYVISTDYGYSIYEKRDTKNSFKVNQVIGAQNKGSIYTSQQNSQIYIELFPIDYITDPKKHKFRYKDNGTWNDVFGSNTIKYFTSNSGTNIIEIQYVDRDLNYSDIKKVRIDVLKPWYLRTNVAIPLYGGTLILLIITCYSLFNYINKRRHVEYLKEKELERQIQEMEEARQFQMGLLPDKNPSILNLDIATHINTAEKVGGDYYDFFIQKNSNSLIIAIGDATGHGMVAGNIVSITKAGLNSVNFFDSPINEILEKLNKIIKKVGIGRNRMCLNICHIRDDQFEICSAGMPPTYLYKKKTDEIDELMISGLPAGSLVNNKYSSEKFKFETGDILVMITDGLPECEDSKGEFLGYETIKNTIQFSARHNSEIIKDNLKKLGSDWMKGDPIQDDITFMVIKKC